MHTVSSGAGGDALYLRFFEYARVVTSVVVTDEGVYLKDEVPDTYGGAQLEIEMVNAVIMCNSRFELQVFEFENDYPMDKDKKKGGPIQRDGADYRDATGDSTTTVVQTTKLNPNLDDARKIIGLQALAALKAKAAEVGDITT